MKKTVALFLTLPYALFAIDSSIASLEDALEETTQIATKTKLNIDFVPGTVTVITGSKLKSLGITNLAEQNAYDMIVGFDSSVLGLRGSGSIYGSHGNKIKWLINDKPVSAEIWGAGVYGVGDISFPIPVDFVDRVEVIRGAGSAIYGGNAIYGVVNIITKKDTNSVFTMLSRTESSKFGKAVGGIGHYKSDELTITALASAYQNDGWNLNVGTEGNFYDSWNAKHTVGYGPGNLPNTNSAETIMVDADYKGFTFWLYRLKTNNNYAQIQWNPTIPLPKDNDSGVLHNTNTMLGAQKVFMLPDNMKLTGKIGYNLYGNTADSLYVWPASKLTSNSANVEGVKSVDYVEEKQYAELTLEKSLHKHRLLGGVYLSRTAVLKDEIVKNFSGVTYAPNTKSNYLDGNDPKRFQNAFFIQDEMEVSDSGTITIGTRYDAFSDTTGAISPRVAFVYRFNDSNIFKAQFSRAFRPPSFVEMHAGTFNNDIIRPETVDTIELGYVYKTKNVTRKLTIFKSFIKDMITFHDVSYETMNLGKASIIGAEAEIARKFDNVDVGINVAMYDTKKSETPAYTSNFPAKIDASSFALSAGLLANMYMTINTNSNYPTTFWYHYTGKKLRLNNEVTINGDVYTSWTGYRMARNGSTPPQDYLNISQKVKGLVKNLELDFGVKNAFGKTLKTLYMPLNRPNTNDVPYMRQTLWFGANYKF